MLLQPELFWRADAAVDAARKLPDWKEFHRLCGGSGPGRHGLCFDHPTKDGRAYTCQAFRAQRNDIGGYNTIPLATGRGPTVLDAVLDAYTKSGITVAEVEPLIDRRLAGVPKTVMPDDGVDDFDCLLATVAAADDFEELMG